MLLTPIMGGAAIVATQRKCVVNVARCLIFLKLCQIACITVLSAAIPLIGT